MEVETIREVQKQEHYSPLKFGGLHKDIMTFANTGRLSTDSTGYKSWFMALRQTNLGQRHGIKSESVISKLYVSSEFTRTLHFPSARTADNFQVSYWIGEGLAEQKS